VPVAAVRVCVAEVRPVGCATGEPRRRRGRDVLRTCAGRVTAMSIALQRLRRRSCGQSAGQVPGRLGGRRSPMAELANLHVLAHLTRATSLIHFQPRACDLQFRGRCGPEMVTNKVCGDGHDDAIDWLERAARPASA
jgi:hypothetical protein